MEAMHARPSKLAQARASKGVNKVLVCGVSYKPNVSDTRDAPQSDFVHSLLENDVTVHFFDPLVDAFEGLDRVADLSCAKDYDKVFVMHKHDTCREQLEDLRHLPNVEFFG